MFYQIWEINTKKTIEKKAVLQLALIVKTEVRQKHRVIKID